MTSQYGQGGINLAAQGDLAQTTNNSSVTMDGTTTLWIMSTDGDGDQILTLAPASSWPQRTFFILTPDAGASGKPVSVVPADGESLNGSTTGIALEADNEAIQVFSDGGAWYIVGHSTGTFPPAPPPTPPPPPTPGGNVTAAGFAAGDGLYGYTAAVGFVDRGGGTMHTGTSGGTSYVIYSFAGSWLAFDSSTSQWWIFSTSMPNPSGGYSNGDPIPGGAVQVQGATASVTVQEGTDGPDAATAVVGTLTYSSPP